MLLLVIWSFLIKLGFPQPDNYIFLNKDRSYEQETFDQIFQSL